jgi:Na+-transporting NADH:ubiquinone oxidoreductase subunit C
MDPENVNSRRAANDPMASTEIPADADLARIGRRADHEVVYLVWGDEGLSRIILPIHGQGMWSTLYGLIALKADLNTIAAVTFYEQTETAGLGDQIQRPVWQALWQGRQLFGGDGGVRFRVASGVVEPGARDSEHEVDGLSGATVTGTGVTNLVRFWFGSEGYGPLLAEIREAPPVQTAAQTSRAKPDPTLLEATGD